MKLATFMKRHAGPCALLLGGLALPALGLAQDEVDLSSYGNNSFVSLQGTVESVSPDTFILSYDDGSDRVTVEMDDGDRDADAYQLLPGDEVTVYGVMDKDLFEMRKIEASSVYVEKLNTWFQASAIDEEDYLIYPPLTIVTVSPADGSGTGSGGSPASGSGAGMDGPDPLLWLQGEVSGVEDDSFTLTMDNRDVTVTVASLADNPLDDEGYRKIENGDVVSVLGNIDGSFFDSAELEAESVTKVHDKEDI